MILRPPPLLLLLLLAAVVGRAQPPAEEADDAAPVPLGHVLDDDLQTYLMRYGYLSRVRDGVAALRTEESVREAVARMQTFAHVPVTGLLDERTRPLLTARRCGRPDVEDPPRDGAAGSGGRYKRYMLHHGRPWDHNNLTWTLVRSGIPPNIHWHEARQVIAKALDLWARHSKLTFTEVSDVDAQRADIVVSFYSGEHGDNFNFDGRGQVLAHAFFPGSGKGGDVHFDSDELWVSSEDEDPTSDGTSLFKVAAHEFGHSLGLSHSSIDGALMAPYYQAFSVKDFDLPSDDRLGIQALYGVKDTRQWGRIPSYRPPSIPRPTTTIPTTTTTTTTTTTRRPTTRATLPMTTRPRRHYPTRHYPTRPSPRRPYPTKSPRKEVSTYPTKPPRKEVTPAWKEPPRRPPPPKKEESDRKGKEKFRHPKKGHDRYPVKENEKPDMCKTSFDAAALIRREVFFFKDRYFWRIGDKGLYEGYPFLITSMFMELPTNLTHVDAVYERPDNKIVIFIGQKFYVFSMTTRIRLEPGYPRPLTDLGLPPVVKKIDGATVWGYNGKTFLYSQHEYWRVDDNHAMVELDYPREIRTFWKGLPNHIDAVFQWRDGNTYFLKGPDYYKFNDKQSHTEQSRPIGPYFLGCQNWAHMTDKEPYTAPEHSSAAPRGVPSPMAALLLIAVTTRRVPFI